MITLATLAKATEQEVFDQVVKHMLTQGVKSEEESGSGCLYRGPRGLKCAAGCLIGDDEFRLEMDDHSGGTGWYDLANRGIVPVAHKGLIQILQGIHDNSQVTFWPKMLAGIAKERGLQFNE